jgi:hypothetical protein
LLASAPAAAFFELNPGCAMARIESVVGHPLHNDVYQNIIHYSDASHFQVKSL